jgi:hypothetical protein|tara:strand:- start:106 stop:378 length:273 start_codon:yes stop_codon:yes gene_type:complete
MPPKAKATPAERKEINDMRDKLLKEVKQELEDSNRSFLHSLAKLGRFDTRMGRDSKLKKYRKEAGIGAGRPKRAITQLREAKAKAKAKKK